jgi:putative pre-16S rRNA nuclease
VTSQFSKGRGVRRTPCESGMTDSAAALHPLAFPLHARCGTVLAFDFGEKRIGVAVGEYSVRVAHPLTTLHAANSEQKLAAVEPLVREWEPALLVVGLPFHPDGAEHDLTRAARRFAGRLKARFAIETVLVDERYTSTAADEALRGAGTTGRRRRSALDPVAAQQILQAFFDEHPHST